MNEEFDIQAVWDHRREAAADSLRSASVEEIKQLINTIFTDRTTHPWFERFQAFVDGHNGETILRGEVPDGIGFVYYPKSNRGMWFKSGMTLEAVGLVSGRGLTVLGELAAVRGLA